MSKYSKLLGTLPIFICFIGCSVKNKVVSVEKNIETRSIKEAKEDKPVHISHKKLKVATATPINTVKKRVKASQEKPLEVARVCFDKKGVAHNCNYKIAPPYKQSEGDINQRLKSLE